MVTGATWGDRSTRWRTRCGVCTTTARTWAWITEARNANQEVLITFGHCDYPPSNAPDSAKQNSTSRTAYCAGESTGAVDTTTYAAAVEAFMNASDLGGMGRVRWYSAWNEPNLKGTQPTAGPVKSSDTALTVYNSGAYRAGRYWRKVFDLCQTRHCGVLAGEFIDASMGNPAKRNSAGGHYFTQYRKGMGRPPKIWSWHAYRGASKRIDPGTPVSARWKTLKAFRNRTASSANVPIWLSEQGARVRFDDGPVLYPPKSGPGELLRNLLNESPEQSPRIKRFYYYQFKGNPKYDAGLVSPDSTQAKVNPRVGMTNPMEPDLDNQYSVFKDKVR